MHLMRIWVNDLFGSLIASFRNIARFASMNPNAELILPQGRHVQEHRKNSNAFVNIKLKRHECRAPSKRGGILTVHGEANG